MKKLTENVHILFTPEQKRKLKDIASESGLSSSGFVRNLVLKVIKEHEQNIQ